jgi:iron complex outermembrane receptor protein
MAKHGLVWGLQARRTADDVNNVGQTGLLPEARTVYLFGIYVQDEVVLVPDSVKAIFGFKLEHNSFSRFEFQPNVRFSWEPVAQTVVWGAVSRAVRTPVRADHNLVFSVRSANPVVRANTGFDAEKLTAFELGFRSEFSASVSLDVAAFYNVYDDLKSQERTSGPTSPLTFKNNLEGDTYGVETSFLAQLTPTIRATIAYGYLQKHLRFRPGTVDLRGTQAEGNDAKHIGSLRLSAALTRKLDFDVTARGVSSLPIPHVPGYVELDARLAYMPSDQIEIAVAGRDLIDDQHPEFGAPGPQREEIQRSVFAEISWRF